MIFDVCLLTGVLFGVGTYLFFEKNLVHIVLGTIVLSNGVNIFLLAMSGNPIGKTVPILLEKQASFVDPLPQALILTAIVISFAVTSYLIVFSYILQKKYETNDIEEILLKKDSENER